MLFNRCSTVFTKLNVFTYFRMCNLFSDNIPRSRRWMKLCFLFLYIPVHTLIHTYVQLKYDSMPRLQSEVQRCITLKDRLRYKERLFIKVSLKFLFKSGSVSYHSKVTRQTVPFCRSREREGTFSEFCTQAGFRVDAAASWTQTRSTTGFHWRAHQFSEICVALVLHFSRKNKRSPA